MIDCGGMVIEILILQVWFRGKFGVMQEEW